METRSVRLVDGTSALASAEPFETEFAKDRWDAHNIPGLRYPAHTSHYYISFTIVPANWRLLIKEYARYLVAADRASHSIDHRVRQLAHFLHFFSQRYPQATDLHVDHQSPSRSIKYIPQAVLEQLDKHLHRLTAVYIPVMIVLRASGWRISDVLALKWETCLEQQNEKYCLVGDIQKTRILGHRIPISQEVA